MSTVAVTLCLRTPDDLFRTPDIDPYSQWYQPYSLRPAIEYVEARVGDSLRADHLDRRVLRTIRLRSRLYFKEVDLPA